MRVRLKHHVLAAAHRREPDDTEPLGAEAAAEQRSPVPLGGPQRLITFLLSLFGLMALALGAVGIYGVISCRVSRRTFEIGVRMALGARRREVLGMVLRQGLGMAVWGAILGILGALATARLLAGFLYGIAATDPITLGAVTFLMLLVAALACYLPARRATQVDPIQALRID